MREYIWVCIILALLSSVLGGDYITQYDVTSQPFLIETNFTYTAPGGEGDLTVFCAGCILTRPENLSFLFSNFSNHSLSFISNFTGLPNAIYTEHPRLFVNLSEETTDNITFIYNVSVPAPVILVNFSIQRFTPDNDSYIGLFDEIPQYIEVQYTGNINFNASTFQLFLNGTTFTSYNLTTGPNLFRLVFLNITNEGIFEGNWVLVDNHNQSKSINYRFQMRQAQPPKPTSISPAIGEYSNELTDLKVTMPDTNYTLYYLTFDGLPPVGEPRWKQMTLLDGVYAQALDFTKEPIGSIYLKIVDRFGNIRIQPTSIISSPQFQMSFDERSKSVAPGDEIALELTFTFKQGISKAIQCRMPDFKSKTTTSGWSVRNTVKLINQDDEEDYVDIYGEYDEPVKIESGDNRLVKDLQILVPLNINPEEDYTSKLECRYS
jgi:hypothetical protein